MNKHPSKINNLHFGPHWSQELVIEWISSNKKIIVWIACTLFIIFVGFYWRLSTHSAQSDKDFFSSHNIFQNFQQNAVNSPSSNTTVNALQSLQELISRHPELAPKYEGPLAQTLLITDQLSPLPALTKKLFERTSIDVLDLYHKYSTTSLLIVQGKWSEAMQATLQLQELLNSRQEQEHQILLSMNLLRLGILNKELGNREEELQIWNQMTKHWNNVPNLREIFTIGTTTFEQWVANRKTELESRF